MFVEADLPSPLMGYPGALGLDLSAEAGNFPAILKKVEQAVIDKGGAGRFGTWAFSYGFTVTAGLGEFAKNVVDGKTTKDSLQGLYDALAVYTPGAQWNGGYYIDANTGVTRQEPRACLHGHLRLREGLSAHHEAESSTRSTTTSSSRNNTMLLPDRAFRPVRRPAPGTTRVRP